MYLCVKKWSRGVYTRKSVVKLNVTTTYKFIVNIHYI